MNTSEEKCPKCGDDMMLDMSILKGSGIKFTGYVDGTHKIGGRGCLAKQLYIANTKIKSLASEVGRLTCLLESRLGKITELEVKGKGQQE